MNIPFNILCIVAVIFTLANYTHCRENNPNLPVPYQNPGLPPKMDPPMDDTISPPTPGWIDPFDIMSETPARDRPSHNRFSLNTISDVEIHTLKQRCHDSEMYLRRFVNYLINAAGLRNKQLEGFEDQLITLEFSINNWDLKTLRDFGQNEFGLTNIKAVDTIISRIFIQKKDATFSSNLVTVLKDIFSWCLKTFKQIISSPEWTVLSSVLLLMFLTLYLVYYSHSYRLAMFTVFLTIFLAGFGFTWMRMYEEAEIKRYVMLNVHGPVPRHCSKEAQYMAWYEHIYYRMFGVDCIEFYKHIEIRPILKFSPTEVLVETFTSMFITPAKHIGQAYGNFITSVVGISPWYLKPVIVPFAFFAPLAFTIILFSFLFNYRLSLSITGLHLYPSWCRSEGGFSQEQKYIQECPRKESVNPLQSTITSSLETDQPMFIMNWKGLKKVSSSLLLGEKRESNSSEITTESGPSCDGQLVDNSDERLSEELQEFEEFMVLMESKQLEERKRRSIHTSAEGGSSLVRRKGDSKEKDRSHGDDNVTIVNSKGQVNSKSK